RVGARAGRGASAGVSAWPTPRRAPEKRPERPFPNLKLEETTGVRDRRLDLLAVAHDARILEELGDLLAVVACHALGIEAVEDLEEASAFVQDSAPGKPGLEAVQHELREQEIGRAHV